MSSLSIAAKATLLLRISQTTLTTNKWIRWSVNAVWSSSSTWRKAIHLKIVIDICLNFRWPEKVFRLIYAFNVQPKDGQADKLLSYESEMARTHKNHLTKSLRNCVTNRVGKKDPTNEYFSLWVLHPSQLDDSLLNGLFVHLAFNSRTINKIEETRYVVKNSDETPLTFRLITHCVHSLTINLISRFTLWCKSIRASYALDSVNL